jgi:MOSC domain-containing protein YiiM
MNLEYPLTGLYAARPSVLQPGGERSAILKHALARAVITRHGIVGDEQADRRFHGGPDKALHQYAQASYTRILTQYPELAGVALPGSIGENLSCPELAEHDVCIGDQWRVGTAVVEVTQPRSPCTKIDSRYQQPGLASFIVREHLNGWYLRVVQEGVAAPGDRMTLLARPNPAITLARFLAVTTQHRPPLADLEAIAAASGLATDWQRRLLERCRFLHSLE